MDTKVTTPIKVEVEAMLSRDTWLRNFPIDVIDNHGIIILQGEVPSEAMSMIAEGLARQVDGVVSVSNELYIKPL